MVRTGQILAGCTGFEWDESNATKNWDRCDVSMVECEQIFFNKPLMVKRDKAQSLTENRYYTLGRTDTNRLLFVVFTVRTDRIRVISARDMTDREIERYQQW
jgi:hypothetical protein